MFFTIEVNPLAGINAPPSVGCPMSSTAMGYCDVVFVDSHLNEAVARVPTTVPPPPKPPMTPARPLVYLSHASPTRYVYVDMRWLRRTWQKQKLQRYVQCEYVWGTLCIHGSICIQCQPSPTDREHMHHGLTIHLVTN